MLKKNKTPETYDDIISDEPAPVCKHCGMETWKIHCDATYYPELWFSVVCPRCGAMGPAYNERFDYDEAEKMARELFRRQCHED
jgi:hypothetical protein